MKFLLCKVFDIVTGSSMKKPIEFGIPGCGREANQYAEQVTDFCKSIAAGKLLAPAEDGVANMRVLEAALAVATASRGC
jgi:hypothetical protein